MTPRASRWSRLRSSLRALVHRDRLETEMAEELRFHLEARAADLAARGLSPSEAARQARIEFGGGNTPLDGMRRALGLRWTDELTADLRYAARLLRKSPSFTVIAVLSLALALGANTTIFSFANAVLYARLGVPHPEQLRLLTLHGKSNMAVHSTWGEWDEQGDARSFDSFSYPVYQQLRRQNRVLADLFAFKRLGFANVTAAGSAQAVQLELVSGNFYTQMGVRPALGRPILPSDDASPGQGGVAVISDGFWARAFGRSPSALGATIQVNATPVTIVGVNPPGFTGAESAQSSTELFMPLSMIPLLHGAPGRGGPYLANPDIWWVQVMGRTRPGITDAQVTAALDQQLVAAIHATMHPKPGDTMPWVTADDGSKGLNSTGRQFASPLHVLLAMVGLVLLLACANLANLMLARAAVRQREMGVRLALGASRWRVLRQVLTESLLLAVLGGGLGALLGFACRSVLPRLMSDDADFTVAFDWKVFAFTAAITLATGVLFGVAPAWASTRAEIGTALKDGGAAATRRRRHWSGKSIVAFQVALSTLLVAGAALFVRTVVNLNSVKLGFEPDHLLLFDVNVPSLRYPAPKDVALLQQLEDTIRSVPGVESVSFSDTTLVSNSQSTSDFFREGESAPKLERGDKRHAASYANVGQDFMRTMRIPLLSGRDFSPADVNSPRHVAIVNQTLVRKYFPGQNPIGKRFSTEGGENEAKQKWFEIIGVCGDTRYSDLKSSTPPLHFDLYTDLYPHDSEIPGGSYIVRTRLKSEAIVPSLRAAIARIDINLPMLQVRTQQEQIRQTMQTELMFSTLASGFGLMALALACVGVYGIMAYTVAQRRNEIGIRLALGAARRQIGGMVLREAGWLALLGVVAGLGTALALGRLVKEMLFGLAPYDVVSLGAAAALLATVALLAALLPAMRAARVEPMEALRHD